MRVIVTRPVEDAAPLRAKLEAMGYDVIVSPLMTIEPREDVEIADRPWALAVATSANAIRMLPKNHDLQSLRLLTVGPQSLAAARKARFIKAEAHGGDIKNLAQFILTNFAPDQGPILYLSGADTAGDLAGILKARGYDCVRIVLYDAVPATSLGPAGPALKSPQPPGALLYSPRTARIWLNLVATEGLLAEAARASHFCLSVNVANLLPEDWRKFVAEKPDEPAMLALLEQIGGTR